TRVEVTEGDVDGLEVKLHRGSTITGVVVIEGASERTALSRLAQLSIGASSSAEGLNAPISQVGGVAPDGTFRIGGIRPGKVRLFLATYPPPKGLSLGRIERDGIVQPALLDVAPGAQLSGIRVVVLYGSGSVRGMVRTEGGTLPEGARMTIFIKPVADGALIYNPAIVDARGHFLLDGLPTGDYELTINTMLPGDKPRWLPPLKQQVSITSGIESQVTLTLDLSAAPVGGRR
ncbi:MAG TPA: carboxypeptidase-like regulatory domain-containing protein, partial [Pyrinomonadaceae bacterium]